MTDRIFLSKAVRIALPVAMQGMLNTIVNMVDTAVVRYGKLLGNGRAPDLEDKRHVGNWLPIVEPLDIGLVDRLAGEHAAAQRGLRLNRRSGPRTVT